MKIQRILICSFLLGTGILTAATAQAQTAGLGLNPSRLEMEVGAGQEKTMAFDIESPVSESSIRGRLLLSLTDWDVNQDGTVKYSDPGTLPMSASSWVVFSPTGVTITSGQTQQARVTVRVPKGAVPGVYRSGIFVQERPPATPAKKGEHLVYLRYRFVLSLYVIVSSVRGHGELVDAKVEHRDNLWKIAYALRNTGARHVRPLVSWSLRNPAGETVASMKDYESMVLLPGRELKHSFPIAADLPSGDYLVETLVDFQDSSPLQSMKRTIRIGAPVLRAAGAK